MKRTILYVALLIAASAALRSRAALDGAETDTLQFLNGDRLRGALLSAAPDTGLRWRSAEATEIISFKTDNIAEVKLASHAVLAPPASAATPTTVLTLTNGDRLAGELVSLTPDAAVLRTGYAGTLTIKRAMLRSLTRRGATPEIIYAGPTGWAGWIRSDNDNAWKYADGVFSAVGQGGIGREVPLPDAANLEFDLSWRGEWLLMVGVYTDNLDQLYDGSAYVLQLTNNEAQLQRTQGGQGFNDLGAAVAVTEFQNQTKAHIGLHVSRAAKTIALMVNGALIKEWTDPGEFAGKGRGIIFFAQHRGGIQLSHITVTAWDGQRPLPESAPATAADQLRLVNNDKLTGIAKGIANNELTFVTSYATLKIALERVARLDLAGAKAEQARRHATDVRAWFASGDHVTLALDKLDDKSLVGASENFGRATFNRDAFGKLSFHIHDQPAKSADEPKPEF